MSFLGRVNYFGGWYDYDSGFAQAFLPAAGIEQGFFDGRPIVDLEFSIALGGGATLAVGGQNAFNTYPQVTARAMSVGERYSEYTPWGFNGAYYYVPRRLRLGQLNPQEALLSKDQLTPLVQDRQESRRPSHKARRRDVKLVGRFPWDSVDALGVRGLLRCGGCLK